MKLSRNSPSNSGTAPTSMENQNSKPSMIASLTNTRSRAINGCRKFNNSNNNNILTKNSPKTITLQPHTLKPMPNKASSDNPLNITKGKAINKDILNNQKILKQDIRTLNQEDPTEDLKETIKKITSPTLPIRDTPVIMVTKEVIRYTMKLEEKLLMKKLTENIPSNIKNTSYQMSLPQLRNLNPTFPKTNPNP